MQKNYLIRKFMLEGIKEEVIEAFKKVKRENFVLKKYKQYAYDDVPLPIGHDQTISQPSTVIFMTNALDVKKTDKILEIGTGSGYQAAILSKLAKQVYTTEIIDELYKYAKEKLKNFKNVKVIKKDGSEGLEEYKFYDKIILTAASREAPRHLLKQLKENGILLAPVGNLYIQDMIKLTKDKTESLGKFVFVPLKGKYGFTQ
ncbi:MAG TPA: protein-L-isoaspartate(D-aspartate) O-methyltransferase [Candidatus Nanoarchaeia archaeon]|nr:protein-L-isoaspartate(D-aspartate) O-methyltransferase [Candidatus Nanoarchaeia archaeon]